MKKISLILLVSLSTMIFFGSCEKDDNDAFDERIIGTWQEATSSSIGLFQRYEIEAKNSGRLIYHFADENKTHIGNLKLADTIHIDNFMFNGTKFRFHRKNGNWFTPLSVSKLDSDSLIIHDEHGGVSRFYKK